MSTKGIFWIVDKLLCRYLGLKEESVVATSIDFVNNKISINSNTPYKRHNLKLSWQYFSQLEINKKNKPNQERLGLALGNTIAKNLTVSFEEPTYTNGNDND
ncbi:MAG: hypothetical protein P1U34_06910 [Coxiellaceae bacterium]|nr:hypothetical protein [Coxiellaceae bacterium]